MKQMLDKKINFNIYMFEGGTNFAFLGGKYDIIFKSVGVQGDKLYVFGMERC